MRCGLCQGPEVAEDEPAAFSVTMEPEAVPTELAVGADIPALWLLPLL